MSDAKVELKGPDLTQGIPEDTVVEGGLLLGHALGEPVVVTRRGAELFAVGATCTHYSGPLAEGLVVGEEVRCPYHHAGFSLRTGEAVRAPARDSIPTWKLERKGGTVRVTGRAEALPKPAPVKQPEKVVIVGAGAAGQVALETLRREGYAGSIALVGGEAQAAVDRPNLSKDYLAGSAPEEWMPLRPPEWYAENKIDLHLGKRATALDTTARTVTLEGGQTLAYDALLLCTGADPIPLTVPGATLPHVHVMRTLADSRAVIAAAKQAKRAVVVGSSFIGLEVAAALRTRGLEVAVVSRDSIPLDRILGREVGEFVRRLHEEHGVVFHLSSELESIDAQAVTLKGGAKLPADLVVTGLGVRPSIEFAKAAGLTVEDGIVVDAQLRTSAPQVFAAGDAARYPDAHSGKPTRIEHWVVAQRMGATAARNILGRSEKFADAPFFWSQHYDVPIAYTGQGRGWEKVEVQGSLTERNCTVSYWAGGNVLAVATIYRDVLNLQAEDAWERGDQPALARLARTAP